MNFNRERRGKKHLGKKIRNWWKNLRFKRRKSGTGISGKNGD